MTPHAVAVFGIQLISDLGDEAAVSTGQQDLQLRAAERVVFCIDIEIAAVVGPDGVSGSQRLADLNP